MLVRRGKYWHLRIQFDNTLYQKSLHTSNKIKAQKLESAFRWSLLQGEYGIIDGAQAPTLKEFEARLLPHLKENCAPRTYGFYRENLQALNNFETLAKSKLSKIDPSLIEKFIQWRLKPDGKARAAITVNHSLRTLRRCLIDVSTPIGS